jgi:ketosteroid isomerase-like protein
MKKLVFIAVLLAAGAAMYALALRVEAKVDDQAEIAALEDHLISSIRKKDLEGVMAVYVPDYSLFVFDVIPPRQYVGASAYREDWKGCSQAPMGRQVSSSPT